MQGTQFAFLPTNEHARVTFKAASFSFFSFLISSTYKRVN